MLPDYFFFHFLGFRIFEASLKVGDQISEDKKEYLSPDKQRYQILDNFFILNLTPLICL